MCEVVSKVLLNLKSCEVLSSIEALKGVDNIVETNTAEGEIKERMEAEVVDDLENADVDFDDSVCFENKPLWMTITNTINPSFFQFLVGLAQQSVMLNCLVCCLNLFI